MVVGKGRERCGGEGLCGMPWCRMQQIEVKQKNEFGIKNCKLPPCRIKERAKVKNQNWRERKEGVTVSCRENKN